MVVLVASLFVTSIVFAATTISANITTGGTLTVSGLTTLGAATGTHVTSTEYVSVALGDGSVDYLNFGGGDLYVQDDLEVDSDVRIGGNASTTGDLWVSGGTADLTTSTATTTPGVIVRDTTLSTSTVSIGDPDGAPGCLEMVRDGAYYRCYLDKADLTKLTCGAGRCN